MKKVRYKQQIIFLSINQSRRTEGRKMPQLKYKWTKLYLPRRRKIYFEINFTIRPCVFPSLILIYLSLSFIPFVSLSTARQGNDIREWYSSLPRRLHEHCRSFETDFDVIRLTKFRFITLRSYELHCSRSIKLVAAQSIMKI